MRCLKFVSVLGVCIAILYSISLSARALTPWECPASDTQWGVWRSVLIDRIRDKGMIDGASLAAKRLEACATHFLATIGTRIEKNPLQAKFDQCFGPIQSFAASFGLSSINPKPMVYRREAEALNPKSVKLAPELATNRELLELTSTGLNQAAGNPSKQKQVIGRIRDLVTRLNPRAKVLAYNSRHFQAPGLSQGDVGRLLVYFPGADADQWLQWGLPDRKYSPPQSGVSLVSVVKKDGAGSALKPPQSYFEDLTRVGTGGTVLGQYVGRKEVVYCRKCHENGPNPIWPKEGSNPPPDAKLSAELNDVMGSYGKVSMPGLPYATGPLSPSFGAVAVRNPENTPGCSAAFKKRPLGSRKRILGAMLCAYCHDGIGQAPISLIQPKPYIKSAIVSGAMPPGNSLSAEERQELYGCLIGETAKLGTPSAESGLIQRLREQPCELAPPVEDPSARFENGSATEGGNIEAAAPLREGSAGGLAPAAGVALPK